MMIADTEAAEVEHASTPASLIPPTPPASSVVPGRPTQVLVAAVWMIVVGLLGVGLLIFALTTIHSSSLDFENALPLLWISGELLLSVGKLATAPALFTLRPTIRLLAIIIPLCEVGLTFSVTSSLTLYDVMQGIGELWAGVCATLLVTGIIAVVCGPPVILLTRPVVNMAFMK